MANIPTECHRIECNGSMLSKPLRSNESLIIMSFTANKNFVLRQMNSLVLVQRSLLAHLTDNRLIQYTLPFLL